MGASNSKIEEDKALQLCRERKKYIKQALNGRCSLAATHVSYIQCLRNTGTALKQFVQPVTQVEPSLYTSNSGTPEPHALIDKSISHLSYSSSSVNQHVDTTEHLSPTPPHPASARSYSAHHMKFKSSFTKKVEEKLPTAIAGTVTSSSTPRTTTPRSHDHGRAEAEPFDESSDPVQSSPWDFFGLSHPIDNHLSSSEQGELDIHIEDDDDYSKQIREKDEIPETEDEEDIISSHGQEASEESDDEFDEFDDPSSDTLVRSFENLNRGTTYAKTSASPPMLTAGSAAAEDELLNGKEVQSPKLSPLRTKSPEVAVHTEAKMTPVEDEGFEHKVAPKDFFSSMRDVEDYFLKASDSGREVPKMLEANKLHFRPILPGQESGGSSATTLLKACFSCGDDPSDDPSEVKEEEEEPAQASVKYLTWHRTESSRSSDPIASNSREDIEDITSSLFDSFSMISGSHASTLDRLFAWECRLYDEVKASQIIRRDYDIKCRLLREQESKDERTERIYRTRAVVKDLHSRIRVAIHRIDSISKRIEDIRDKELQPQLEELIEGLRRMWEVMSECHRLQLHTVTVSCSNGSIKIVVRSESQRHFALHLQGELNTLASSFMKWIDAHKLYLRSIKNWLLKCAPVTQKPVKRKRRQKPPQLRHYGPPIYTTCEVWLDMLDTLPTKDVSDAIKGLAAEISSLLPHQDRHHHGKKSSTTGEDGDPALEVLNDSASEDTNAGYDQFKPSLVVFLSKLSNFAESSVEMYVFLEKEIQEAKRTYEHLMSQP